VNVVTSFGADAALISYKENIILVPDVLVMPQGLLSTQIFRITHGAVEGNRMRNRVSGKATITFYVNDPGNIYHGTGLFGSAKSVEVYVLPGFESNVQDTYKREVQRDTHFVLTLMLDEATLQDINISATSSNTSAATVVVTNRTDTFDETISSYILIKAGSRGPLHVVTKHRRPGVSQVSVNVLTHGGNYGGVEFINYLQVSLMPGFTTSVREIKVQYSLRTTSFSLGLDTRPDADVELFISTSDSSVITATPSLYFYAATWYPEYTQDIQIVWQSAGESHISFTASSPGGLYNRASCCDVKVKT